MIEEIKTIEERKKSLIETGKKNGYVTYEQLVEELKGLDVDSDTMLKQKVQFWLLIIHLLKIILR